ncbi:MAG: flagellar hook-associated protein FlgK [Deltaproteobacteria bacterium]|nr:flagellar hook-associated protein FlgK [Deltaproteobacteria bacterium]
MSTLSSVLNIAKTSLLANQKAINVTSHNISNANTPGYTRQKAVVESMDPVNFGGLFYGTGVKVANVERIYDNFQGVQLRGATSTLNSYKSFGERLTSLEAAVNDFNDAGLSVPLNNFFNSFEDISNNPSSYAERSTLLSNATVLTDKFNSIDSTIRQGIDNINNDIESQVGQINSIAAQIADINGQIGTIEVAGLTANDLRDKRDLLLDNLSEMVDFTTMEDKTGQVDVYVAGGSFLVSGKNAAPLEVAANNGDTYYIQSHGSVINDRISGGSLRGVLDATAYYQDSQNKLNRMAASLIKEVNTLHKQGFGLDGSTGVNFFAPQSITTEPGTSNSGGAVITAGAISDISLLTLDDYEVRFSGPSNYNVINKNSGSIVTGGAYVSGSLVTVEGISFKISDNTGSPAAGDTFSISSTKYAAQFFSLSVTDANKVAASSTAAGLPGDNINALALADLRNTQTIEGTSYSQYYNSLVSDVGVVMKESTNNSDAQTKFVEELQSAKESTSGVSIEEEAINLVKLQRAYEAAAKVLTTVDKMMEAVINLR